MTETAARAFLAAAAIALRTPDLAARTLCGSKIAVGGAGPALVQLLHHRR